MSCELEAVALTHRYGGWAGAGLRDFSAGFSPGITLVTGPNGAGKSTLLRLLAGTLTPTSGLVRWCGQPVDGHPRAYKTVLGYLPQRFCVYTGWHAVEFLTYMARLKRMREEHIAPAVERVLREAHLSARALSPVAALSPGELRRLGLAQALLTQPRVLILDEPFAGLAPEERVSAQGLITSHASAHGRSNLVILATHLLEGLESYAHRVLILRAGVCVADTTPAGLIDDAGLASVGTPLPPSPLESAYLSFLAQVG